MKFNSFALAGVIFCLAAASTDSATAQVVQLGGPLRPGHARPPLYANFGPFKGPGNGGRGGGGGGGGSTAVYYSPAQIRQAYGFNQLSTIGAGQTIAIIDAYGSPSIQKDLDAFDAYFHLPSATVDIRYPNGKPGRNTGWAEETSLDVEWAHAIAPGAKIMLVVAVNSSTTALLGAVDYAVANGATVVSMSWGSGEYAGETADDSHFNVPGVTFVASSGDSGEGTSVEWPAASPYVVGVGGTSLRLDSSNNRTNETAWSLSGGGISQYENTPSWQSGWVGTGLRRCVPDVSYVADPNTGVEVVYNGALYVFGGTSVGAPQWAALAALANAMKGSPLNSADIALYSAAGAPINSADFYDIISGNNGNDTDDFALVGYDLVTGLGSPVANGLIPALP
jgi:subtilase family serine protease